MFGLPSLGSIGEAVCDELGLPEQVGDLVSVGIDAYQGNWVAVAEDVVDFASDDSAPGADGGVAQLGNEIFPDFFEQQAPATCGNPDDYQFRNGHWIRG
jgi:hypothetical protein